MNKLIMVGLLVSVCAAGTLRANSQANDSRTQAIGTAAGRGGAAGTGAASGPRLLAPDDFYNVQDVSDPQVSPDGQWVAYVLSTNDRDSDQARSAIWMVSWDGTQRVALTAAAEGTEKPRWSPDGRFLAFLADIPGSDNNRLMILDRRGGEARPLTKVNGEIGEYAWSPDAKRLVLALKKAEEGSTPKPIVIDAKHFKEDADGYLGVENRRHLFLCDAASGEIEALTSDAGFSEDLPAWSPDGGTIAFTRTREQGVDADGRMDIDLIEPRVGASPRTLTRPYAPNTQRLIWRGDGAMLGYLQGIEPKFNAYIQDRLFVIDPKGGAVRSLTDKLDRAVMSYAFNSDHSTATVAVEDDLTEYPARIDLASGAVTRAVAPTPTVVSSVTAAAGHTALIQTSDHGLAEVYALEEGGLRKLTAHNDGFLSELKLGAVEELRFKSKDGTEIHGLLVKPPDYEAARKYPLLLWIHGGPNGHDEHSLVLDGYQFEPQMFAAKGYVVLRVNYRGGSGRGGQFAKAILADWGHKEVEDLLAGVDSVIARSIADKDRLVVGGWSYGGILTDYTIASDRRFKAAISGAGSGNQLSTYGSDQYVFQYNNELGTPWTNTALWLKVSYPFFHADRIHTPTLFLGGEKDFNVPIAGGEQMYQALRTLGVPAQLVVYPGQHHVFTRPSYIKDLAERMSKWVDQYVSSGG